MRAAFKNIAFFNEEASEKLARWLGWHCSNFAYNWIWEEWYVLLTAFCYVEMLSHKRSRVCSGRSR